MYGPCTDMELVKMLNFSDANRIRPRRYELMKKGIVEEVDRRPCKITGRRAIVWGIK